MKSLFAISSLLAVAVSIPESEWATNPPTLDAAKPIYLASVFYPPQMHFIAWTPSKDPYHLYKKDPLHWCKDAKDVSDALQSGPGTRPFELEGLEDMKIHNFFSDQAFISRHNHRFADCFVTPESRPIGSCEGQEAQGEKHLGAGFLVWSCWVISNPDRSLVLGPREDNTVEKVTSGIIIEGAENTAAMVGKSSTIAFTASATSS